MNELLEKSNKIKNQLDAVPDNWANLELSYGPVSDKAAEAKGYVLIGGARDESGKEVHVFQKWHISLGRQSEKIKQ